MVMHNLLTKDSAVLRESSTTVFVFALCVGRQCVRVCVCVCRMQDADSEQRVEAVKDVLLAKC